MTEKSWMDMEQRIIADYVVWKDGNIYKAKSGKGTTDFSGSDFTSVVNDALKNVGRISIQHGTYYAYGTIANPLDLDYKWDSGAANSPYIRGAGVNSTYIQQKSDADIFYFDANTSGNMGGVSDMSLYGSGITGNGIHLSGAIYDMIFQNLAINQFANGDGISIPSTASGIRIYNAWIENCNNGIAMGNGTRSKISNIHTSGTLSSGLVLGINESQINNLSIYGNQGAYALYIYGQRNQISNAFIYNASQYGVLLSSGYNNLTNINIYGAGYGGIYISSDGNTLSGATLLDATKTTAYYPLRVYGNYNTLSDIYIDQPTSTQATGIKLMGASSYNTLKNITFGPTLALSIDLVSTTHDNVLEISNLNPANVTDDGVRNVVNGLSTNAGDPNTTGNWYGYAQRAWETNATIVDTTASPAIYWKADSSGNWYQVALKSKFRNTAVTTGVAIGVAGSPTTIVSQPITAGYNNMTPEVIKATPSGLGTSETATFHIVATLDDTTTATLASKTTAAGSTATETFTISDYDFSLIADAKRITQIDLTAESSATSTTATATGTVTSRET